MSFSGPLPPPQILDAYDEVVPGAAERILKLAESQAAHRQSLERKVVESDIYKSYAGLTAAFLIVLASFACAVTIALCGYPWAASPFGVAPLAGLVWVFVRGTESRQAERAEKRNALLGGKG